jgi:hypothetical protein
MKQLNITNFKILTILLLISSTSIADEAYPNWSIKGFGNLGLVRSDSNKIGFYRNRTQTQEVNKSLDIGCD